ncbi:hypothetical protein [Crossiella sp. CA198]|uniref:hypothetical protein n=1 Tax=Crossiella sp. CA198 TaxID=3455607 RepID=UPI003F8D347F
MEQSEITLRAVGPTAQGGRLPLAEMARIAGEFQATMERIAHVILGASGGAGRRPREVVDAVRLELTGFKTGSTVLEISAPADVIFDHGLLERSLDAFFAGVEQVSRGISESPSEFTPQVLDGLIRLSGGISPGSIAFLEISRRGGPTVRIDDVFRGRVRALRRLVQRDEVAIVGRLHEGDFAPAALRCRVDTWDASIPCTFDQDLRDRILAAMDSMVMVTGVAETQPDGRIRTLDLLSISIVDEASRRDLGQLAEEQEVRPVTSLSEFGKLSDLGDDDFDQFVNGAMSARS